MTDSTLESDDEQRIRKIREKRQREAYDRVQYFWMLTDASDEELITEGSDGDPLREMEMQRRLKDAVFDLAKEVVTSRKSSEELTGKLDTSIGDLTREIIVFRTSADLAARKSDEAAKTLVRLTWFIVVFTIIVAVLTVMLVILTVRGGQTSPAPARPQPTHSVRASPHRATSNAHPSGKATAAL